MSDDRDAWRDHLESATRSGTGVRRQLAAAAVPVLTVLAHPDPRRVGERAVLPGLLAGKEVSLSRLEPDFAPPRGGEPRPLADPRLSRRPLRLAPKRGGVVVDAAATRTRLWADGEPVQDSRELGRRALANGVVLLLADRVALVLRATELLPPVSSGGGLIGESAAMVRLRREILRLADLPFPVLLRGESGTGKELVARAVHDAGPRRGKPYLAVNVGAIPPALAAAELFGAAKGAYSGADRRRRGYFQQAAGGTLFLDEIGEAPLELQVHLLRAIETGQIQPVGAPEPRTIDVRIISATDADLEAAAAAGGFRSPLLHRLSSYQVVLPALRQRREDFGRLFYHFLRRELRAVGEEERLRPAAGDGRPCVPAELVARLAACAWPGNVRQLRNVVRQLAVSSRGQAELEVVPMIERLLRQGARPDTAAGREPEAPAYRQPDEITEAAVRVALRGHRYEIKPAAAELNVSRTSLYDLMERFAIRKAAELGRDEIERCRERLRGDLKAMALALEVSGRGLKMRMTELGLR